MGLIKSTNSPTALQAFSMADIETQARAVLRRAQEQADALLAEAQKEGQVIRTRAQEQGAAEGRHDGLSKGHEAGRRAGYDQALAEHRERLAQLVSALSSASQQIDASRRELESAAVKDVIQLAVAIAERVTKRQGVLDPEVGLANVMEAMKLVVHASDVRIAIHPSHKATLAEALPRLKAQWPALQHVALVEEPALPPGGCRIYTSAGLVDGDLNEQIRRVVADLLPDPLPAAPAEEAA